MKSTTRTCQVAVYFETRVRILKTVDFSTYKAYYNDCKEERCHSDENKRLCETP